ncbi:MAG: hemin uptake protein HemP [Pseudomonadota bacterium]
MSDIPKPSLAQEPEAISVYNARDLIKNGSLVRILLDDQTYYLRITRAGKLILTK